MTKRKFTEAQVVFAINQSLGLDLIIRYCDRIKIGSDMSISDQNLITCHSIKRNLNLARNDRHQCRSVVISFSIFINFVVTSIKYKRND